MGEQQDGDKKKSDGGGGVVTTAVFKLDMHCDGCAKKVKRSIKHFDGVESVKADCATNKLTVLGKVDPSKIKERLEVKTKKKVELVSPQPNKASKEGGDKKPEEKKSEEKKSDEKKSDEKKPEEKKSEGKPEVKKAEEKKEKSKEPQVSTVVLNTRVHCEGCAQKIRKIVGKCEGVQDVKVDLQKDTITIKGTMNMKELLPYLNIKLKRAVELAQPKKDEGAAGGDKKAKEGGGGGASEKPKEGGGGSEKPKEGGGDKKEGGGEKKKDGGGGEKGSTSQENTTKIEVNKMEYGGYPYGGPGGYGYGYGYNYTYDPRQQQGDGYDHQVAEYWHQPAYSHPPQMFSDENPNACSVM